MISQNQTPATPQLTDLLMLLKRDILMSINCVQIGTIQKFDAAKQTAEVVINFKKVFFPSETGAPTFEDYPALVDVPVVTIFGGLASLQVPIATGDQCLLFFNDRDINNWFATGQSGPPASARMHSLADAFALVGIRPLAQPITTYDDTRMSINYGTTVVGVGVVQVKIGNATFTLGGLIAELMTNTNALTAALLVFGAALNAAGDPAVQGAGTALVAAITPIQVANGLLTAKFAALLE